MRYFDARKALEAIVFVSHQNHDLFHIVKILYFADKFHLTDYGRLITGDRYVAMKDGPVPSGAFDIIKSVRGDGFADFGLDPVEAFRVDEETEIKPLREARFEFLSESEVQALEKAIEVYSRMSFADLWDVVHEEEAYINASRNNDISLTSIINSLENSDFLLEYLSS